MPRGNGDVKRRRIRRRVDVTIPIAALSVNKMYSGRKRRSYFYKQFRKQVFNYLNDNLDNHVNLKGNLGLSIEVGFSSSLSDLSNSLKAIEDIMTEYLDFNDKQIVHITMDKYIVEKGEEYMKLSIFKTKRNVDRRSHGKEIRK